MSAVSLSAIGDMTVAVCSLNQPKLRFANINLSLIKSLQLTVQLSNEITHRNWKCYKKQLCHFTILFLTILLNTTKTPLRIRLPSFVERMVMFSFPMIQAAYEIQHAVDCLKSDRLSEGFLGIAAVGLRVSQAGSVLATISAPQFPRYHLIYHQNFTDAKYKGVNVSCEHFRNCQFNGAAFYDMFFYKVAFTDSSLVNLNSQKCIFLDCYFENCDLRNAVFQGRFSGVTFKNCHLDGADFSNCIQEDCFSE